ncbi:MAG: DUF4389 domain-containing protein [Pseudomonadales bacterium]|nr:DUF4389 domain-containing protein [Pseudomonadales bacterium]MCP5357441.1 DUF4389 domain-containing protein [Pseudomonadales bacterium]
MSDDIVENLKEPSQWKRIAFMIALAVALYVATIVLTLLTVAQALFSLLTGENNENLRDLGRDLATYVHQIWSFLTYNSEMKPFPFSPYPGSEEEAAAQAAEPVAAPEPEPAPAAKKRAPRKAAAKDKPAAKSKPAAKKAAPKKDDESAEGE